VMGAVSMALKSDEERVKPHPQALQLKLHLLDPPPYIDPASSNMCAG
jgi:hypothetical protein